MAYSGSGMMLRDESLECLSHGVLQVMWVQLLQEVCSEELPGCCTGTRATWMWQQELSPCLGPGRVLSPC